MKKFVYGKDLPFIITLLAYIDGQPVHVSDAGGVSVRLFVTDMHGNAIPADAHVRGDCIEGTLHRCVQTYPGEYDMTLEVTRESDGETSKEQWQNLFGLVPKSLCDGTEGERLETNATISFGNTPGWTPPDYVTREELDELLKKAGSVWE